MATRSRSAKSGQFVPAKTAKNRPATTVTEKVGGGETSRSRSAKSGQFVTEKFAKSHPSTTVSEDK